MTEPFVPKLVKMCAQAGLPASTIVHKVKETNKKIVVADPKKRKVMRAAFLKSKIWPANTTIKIGFLSEPDENLRRTNVDIMEKTVDAEGNSLKVDPLQRQVADLPIREAIIKTITDRLQPIVNVKLMFYDENNELINPNVADIRIDFDDNGGAWSLLGTECLTVKDKKESTMNFGWFDVPTTLHEFCHALGMIHEHQNPKGKTILWDKERVRTWAMKTQGWNQETTDNNIIERYKLDEINGSTFDSKSIMLYFFPGDLVLDPSTNKCCGTGTNQNLMFSPYDVLYLNYNYPLKNASLTPEQFTVKFFNDVFNQQVDVEDLKKQISNTKEDEEKEKEKISTNEPAPSAAHALKRQNALKTDASDSSSPATPAAAVPVTSSSLETPEICKPGCINIGGYSGDQLLMLSVMLFIVIILAVITVIAILKK